MFTGLIQDVGRLLSRTAVGDGAKLEIETKLDLSDCQIGESIAVEGACLTVIEHRSNRFWVDCSGETLKRTTLGKLPIGAPLHLERALRFSDRLGGHLVSGHVDAVGIVRARKDFRDSVEFEIEIPREYLRYVVDKGSIAVDGVSLTVNQIDGTNISLTIIPHTLRETHIGDYRPGREVNLEFDLLAKYIERLLQFSPDSEQKSKITEKFLKENGFWR